MTTTQPITASDLKELEEKKKQELRWARAKVLIRKEVWGKGPSLKTQLLSGTFFSS